MLNKALAFFLCMVVITASAADWPPLPKNGFVSGRAATDADVKADKAAFSAQSEGKVVGKPLRIVVPQYAYYEQDGKKVQAIIIQAEEAMGLKIIGARLANGEKIVDAITQFELLGSKPPKK